MIGVVACSDSSPVTTLPRDIGVGAHGARLPGRKIAGLRVTSMASGSEEVQRIPFALGRTLCSHPNLPPHPGKKVELGQRAKDRLTTHSLFG